MHGAKRVFVESIKYKVVHCYSR